jgi:hypothetical protein
VVEDDVQDVLGVEDDVLGDLVDEHDVLDFLEDEHCDLVRAFYIIFISGKNKCIY